MHKPDSISEELKNLQKSKLENETDRNAVELELASVAEARKRLEKELAKVISTQAVLNNAVTEFRREGWALSRRIKDTERKLYKAIEEKQLHDKISGEGTIIDILTSDAPWRKFAYEHQISGAKQLAVAGRGILGDKRGLGKTLSSLIWLNMLNVKKAIIFTPRESSTAYRKQMPRWAPERPLFDLVAKPSGQRHFILDTLKDVDEWNLLVNFEAWRKDSQLIKKLAQLGAEAVIIDEAHTIKNPSTNAFKGINAVVYPSVGEGPKHVLPMSGTVFLNYPDELWPLAYLVDRDAWPTRTAFRTDYLQQDWASKWRFSTFTDGKNRFLEDIGIRLVQRDRSDTGVEIPPQEIIIHNVEFDEEKYPRQFQAYKTLVERSALVLSSMTEEEVAGVQGLALLTRLRQMITWPDGIQLKDPQSKEVLFSCNVKESVKIDAAMALINDSVRLQDDRVVVFSQFRAPLRELKRRLDTDGISSVVLDGDTPDSVREEIKRDFDASEDGSRWDVVLANFKVAGQSLDFTSANAMVILDEEWNPGRNDQAYGRIDRIGQSRKTTVYVLRVPNTVDDTLRDINEYKAKDIGDFEADVKKATVYLRNQLKK